MNCQICQTEHAKPRATYILCDSCFAKVASYERRFQARVDRLEQSAEKAQKEGDATLACARQMADAIPFGQPILVGHHSEGWDRRYRNRIHSTYQRGFEALKRAEAKARQARIAANNTAIRSDDPTAILKLREKLATLEAKQAMMKAANKIIRKYKTPTEVALKALVELGLPERAAKEYFKPDFMGRVGFADYELQNNNANIRRIRERIVELEKHEQVKAALEAELSPVEEDHGVVTLRRDPDLNRIQLIFGGKPAPEVIALLRQWGFRWSPSNKAWQRQLNGNGETAAQYVLEKLK